MHLPRPRIALAICAALLFVAARAEPVCHPCGPTYCTGTAKHKAALAAKKRGDTLGAGWSPEAERDGAKRVASGELKECHVLPVRRSCACCQAPAYDQRPDYRNDIDLNTRMALPCAAS